MIKFSFIVMLVSLGFYAVTKIASKIVLAKRQKEAENGNSDQPRPTSPNCNE